MATETPNPDKAQGRLRRAPVDLATHKPDCRCFACKAARKRAEKAVVGGDGEQTEVAPARTLTPIDPATGESIYADRVIVVQERDPRARIAEWALMRANGMRNKDIAAKMGIQPNTLNSLISKATREGWLKFDNPADRLEHELAPLIVENIKSHLADGDRKMTIEAAKGIGLFKSHQAVKIENESPQMVLALKIETPVGYDPTTVVTGTIVGNPKLPTE